MIVTAIENNIDALETIAGDLHATLELIGDAQNLSVRQALCLAALCLDRRPDVVLDLGTGRGNSAAVFSVVGQVLGEIGHELAVHTFDVHDQWNAETSQLLGTPMAKRVVPHVGDLTEFDFYPVLEPSRSVLVFWDAHGFAVADTVLTRILPLLVERRHVVVCHDISDNRFHPERKSYGSLPFWRGMDYFYNKRDTSAINIGWLCGIVDQMLPLTDFCYRNDIEIQSFDYSIQRELAAATRDRFLAIPKASHQPPLIQMAYMSMEQNQSCHFPVSEKELVRLEGSASRRVVARLCSINLHQTDDVIRTFEISSYGQSSPRFSMRRDAMVFAPTSLRDHLASRFFDVRSHAPAESKDCTIILELDWPIEAGRHPEVLLQTADLNNLARIKGSESATGWIAPPLPFETCPERLRIVLRFPEAGEYLLPRAIRALLRT